MDAACRGEPHRRCCKIAFGREETWRQKAFALLQAAMERKILRFDPIFDSTIEERLCDAFSLKMCRVVYADTTNSDGLLLFMKKAAEFLLELLSTLLVQTEAPWINLLVGGGTTIDQLLDHGLPAVLPERRRWLDHDAQKRIHVIPATVGVPQQKWSLAATLHAYTCAKLLGVGHENVHPLSFGDPYFTREEDLLEYQSSKRVQEVIAAINEYPTVLITSCGTATGGNFCFHVLEECGKPIPQNVAGEVLYNLYNSTGDLLEYPQWLPLFRLLPDRDLPNRIKLTKDPQANPFISLGVVYGDKLDALRAAISNGQMQWFNHVVCPVKLGYEILPTMRLKR